MQLILHTIYILVGMCTQVMAAQTSASVGMPALTLLAPGQNCSFTSRRAFTFQQGSAGNGIGDIGTIGWVILNST